MRVSHIHMFGMTFIFFVMGLIFSHAYVRPVWFKSAVIALPFLSMIVDIGSWYLTKVNTAFAWTVIIGGALMGLSFAIQWIVSMYQMWFYKYSLADHPKAIRRLTGRRVEAVRGPRPRPWRFARCSVVRGSHETQDSGDCVGALPGSDRRDMGGGSRRRRPATSPPARRSRPIAPPAMASTASADKPEFLTSPASAAYIQGALAAYQNGTRKDERMHKAVAGLSDQDIADVAAYYAGLQRLQRATAGARRHSCRRRRSGSVRGRQEGDGDVRRLPRRRRQRESAGATRAWRGSTTPISSPPSRPIRRPPAAEPMMQALVKPLQRSQIEDIAYFYAAMVPAAADAPGKGDPLARDGGRSALRRLPRDRRQQHRSEEPQARRPRRRISHRRHQRLQGWHPQDMTSCATGCSRSATGRQGSRRLLCRRKSPGAARSASR